MKDAVECYYQCVGMVDFEKIRKDESLICFEMTVQTEEAWEEIFPPLIKFIFKHYNTEKIIAPRNNIPEIVKEIYERIGMSPDTETYLYRTEWGEIPMEVYSFKRADYIN